MEINFEILTQSVIELTKSVGNFILEQRGKINEQNTETKGLNDFVTYVDKTSEKMLVDALIELLPEAGFIAEENTSTKKGEVFNWIIDPLDGTTNFIHGMPFFCISIALQKNDEIVVGVIRELNFDECFYAWQGGAAFMNEKKISVSNRNKLKDCLLATGFPYYDYSRLNEYMELFKYFMKNTHGLRRPGSAAADLAYVACGRFDGFYEYGLKPWDVAAGLFIVQQAGGQVCDFKGGKNYLFGQEIVASNSAVFDEFKGIIEQHF